MNGSFPVDDCSKHVEEESFDACEWAGSGRHGWKDDRDGKREALLWDSGLF
jgi:hypothetical protein